jgi:hypothetical protein
LPENLKKFFKQIKKIYERDSDFQGHLDYLIENGQVKSAAITEDYDAFHVAIVCPKFIVDAPPPPKPKPAPVRPAPKPRQPSPTIEIEEVKPPKKETPPPKKEVPPPPPPKVEPPPPKVEPVKPTPPPPKLEPEEPDMYKEEEIVN